MLIYLQSFNTQIPPPYPVEPPINPKTLGPYKIFDKQLITPEEPTTHTRHSPPQLSRPAQYPLIHGTQIYDLSLYPQFHVPGLHHLNQPGDILPFTYKGAP